MRYVPWILAIIGGWLIMAPFALDYTSAEIAKHNDISVGLAILLGALVWAFSEWRRHGLSTDMRTQHRS